MSNKDKVELIIKIIATLEEHSTDLVQNTDLITSNEHSQELTEIVQDLDQACTLLEYINEPLFINDTKLFYFK